MIMKYIYFFHRQHKQHSDIRPGKGSTCTPKLPEYCNTVDRWGKVAGTANR